MISLDPRTKFFILITANFLLLFHLNSISVNLFTSLLILLFFLSDKKSVGTKLAMVYALSFLLSMINSENKILILFSYIAFSLNIMLPCIYSGILLCSTTTPAAAVAALRKAKISEKIIIPICVMMRFFPTLAQEILHIHNAMKIRRLVTVSTVIKKPADTFEHYIIPILMSTSNSAQDLTIAAVCKGIENQNPHSCIETIQMTIFDIITIIAFTSIIIIGFL